MATGTGPRGQSRATARHHRAALVVIGVGILCSRPVIQAAIVGAVLVGALRGLAHDNRTKNQARLVAWFNKQERRLEHHDPAA